LQTQESLYGLKHAKKMVQDILFLHGEPNFTISEYNHCGYGIFIILVLNVMLFASTSMYEINRLARLVRMFDMKDLGEKKKSWAWKYTETERMVSLVITTEVCGEDTQEIWYE
jgi:hypothetical protein